MGKKIICIYLDDSMCDFKKAYDIAIKKTPQIQYPQSQLKFFENLEPIHDAIDAYWELKEKYNVLILSKPSVYNPLSYLEKRLWVEKHLGMDECEKLILSCDKTLVIGDYLIDDMDQKGILIPKWEHIKFRSEKFPTWDSILKYLL